MTGNKEGVFEKAMEFYHNDEYDKSFPIFKLLAESGYGKQYFCALLQYRYPVLQDTGATGGALQLLFFVCISTH